MSKRAKWKILSTLSIGEQALELRRVVVPAELHELGLAVAARQLHEAKPVAIGVEPERLGIDGDGVAEGTAGRQVVSMQPTVIGGSFGGAHGALPDGRRLAEARSPISTDDLVPRRRLELPRPFGH